jgi:hypothetical protein
MAPTAMRQTLGTPAIVPNMDGGRPRALSRFGHQPHHDRLGGQALTVAYIADAAGIRDTPKG